MKRSVVLLSIVLGLLCSSAAAPEPTMPKLNIGIEAAKGPQDISVSLQILLVLTLQIGRAHV